MVGDVIDTAQAKLKASGAGSVEELRMAGIAMVTFSDDLREQINVIRRFLFTRMYRAPSVMVVRERVAVVVKALFAYYLKNTMAMPERWHEEIGRAETETDRARIVSDYIAGMTDRFALQLYDRLALGELAS